MTPRHRWHRTNRLQTPRNSVLGRDFPGNHPEQKVKKIAGRFERSARVLRLIDVGAVIPPHRLYSARAPIHPKRPYGLTRPVVPPDGSFISGTGFLKEAALRAAPRGLADRRLSVGLSDARDIAGVFPNQMIEARFAMRLCCRAA